MGNVRKRYRPAGGQVYRSNGSIVDYAEIMYRTYDNAGSQIMIPVEHARIHAGKTSQFSAFVELDGNTPGYRLFRTGSKSIHFKQATFVSEKSGLRVEISEEPTISDTGTEVEVESTHNRIESEDDEVTIFVNPTVDDQGLIIDRYYIPGGESPGGRYTGGETSTDWEFILKPNTDYLIKGYRPDGTGDCTVLVKYRWYIGGLL